MTVGKFAQGALVGALSILPSAAQDPPARTHDAPRAKAVEYGFDWTHMLLHSGGREGVQVDFHHVLADAQGRPGVDTITVEWDDDRTIMRDDGCDGKVDHITGKFGNTGVMNRRELNAQDFAKYDALFREYRALFESAGLEDAIAKRDAWMARAHETIITWVAGVDLATYARAETDRPVRDGDARSDRRYLKGTGANLQEVMLVASYTPPANTTAELKTLNVRLARQPVDDPRQYREEVVLLGKRIGYHTEEDGMQYRVWLRDGHDRQFTEAIEKFYAHAEQYAGFDELKTAAEAAERQPKPPAQPATTMDAFLEKALRRVQGTE